MIIICISSSNYCHITEAFTNYPIFLYLLFSLQTVNIRNFESYTPSLSRSNSLRIKKEDLSTPKLSTGTRQLKAHELTYFGIKSAPPVLRNYPIERNISKASFVHLSNNNTITNLSNTSSASKVTISHSQKPDLIMHHEEKYSKSATPELTSSERKSMIETLDSCIDETKNLEPLYENLKQQNATANKQPYDRKSDLKRDEKILSELSRAAEEIMEVIVKKSFMKLLIWTGSGTDLKPS